MKPAYAIYVLKSHWSWDHSNEEFATITIEGCEGERYEAEFEGLVDPKASKESKKSMLHNLISVAGPQNNCPMTTKPRLDALYRVTDFDADLPDKHMGKSTGHLRFGLELICNFDNDNNPVVPAKPASGSSS